MINQKMKQLGQNRSVIRDIFEYGRQRKAQIGAENVFDFSLGNPSVPAPRILTETLERLIKDTPPQILHAYTSAAGDDGVRHAVADYLNKTYNAGVKPEYIYMTCGAAASLTISLTALTEPGDEAAVFSPFFPEYRVFAERAGAKLKVIPSRKGDFQADAEQIEKGITSATKCLIINSPNNPTGAVLTEESIQTIARILRAKQRLYGHPIYLISDEPYRELAYGAEVPYLTKYYDNTIVCYSFSKSLSLPGERIGYVLVSPEAESCSDVFDAICGAGRALGFVCAPSLFQYAIKECLGHTSDLSVYDTNRKLLYDTLTSYGFECVKPDGAFYLFMKTPEPDAVQFCERAREYELLLVPADSFGCEGYVRISYCVQTEQIKSALPKFKRLAEHYGLKHAD